MQYIQTIIKILVFLSISTHIMGQKSIKVLKNDKVIMDISLTGQSALLTKNKIIRGESTLVEDFQKSLKVFDTKFNNMKNYNFEFHKGQSMIIKKATIANTYSIKEDELENIDKNRALLKGEFFAIVIYFQDVQELFSDEWSTYLKAIFNEEKSFLGILCNGRDMVYNVDNGTYTKQERKRIYSLELEGNPLPLKVVGTKYGTGVNFSLGFKFSNSSTRTNKVFAGIEIGTFVGKPVEIGFLGTLGIASDKSSFFIGIPLYNDKGSVYENDSFLIGFRYNKSWGTLSPRIHFNKGLISNLGLELSFPF